MRRLRTRDLVVDVLVAALLVGSAFVPFGGPLGPPANGLRAVPLLLVAALLLPFRRVRPVPVAIGCVVVAVVSTLLGLDTPAFVVPVAIAMYAVALRTDRRTTLAVGIASAAVLPLTSLVHGPSVTAYPAVFLSARAVQLAAIVAFATAAGDAARARRATLEAYAERARRAEESREAEARRRVAEDRLAIARDLHDVVAHQIAVINLHAEVASRTLRSRPDDAERSLETIGAAARSVIADIGELLALLRATGDGPRSIDAVPPQRLDALIDLFDGHGLAVLQERAGDVGAVPPETGTVVYRVVQEGLTNAQKHGTDAAVRLTLTTSDEAVVVELENRTEGARTPGGHGLAGMRERVEAAGGSLESGALDGRFRVRAVVPIERDRVGA